MKQIRALQVLSNIMNWDDELAQKEFAWLRLMSDFKYDSYRDYMAGARFIESLADWLQQFEIDERNSAYKFVRESLLFFSAREVQHLVELVYPVVVQPRLVSYIAKKMDIPAYLFWSRPEATKEFRKLLRQSLFFGLSDGAIVDVFRRVNAGLISNEQVIMVTEINDQKWNGLIEDLQKDLDAPEARFLFVFLLDDFVGTGKTLLRKEEGNWKGRLHRFWDAIKQSGVLEPDGVVCVHHYIATEQASIDIKERYQHMLLEREEQEWFDNVEFTYGLILPRSICITESGNPGFYQLTQKYYDISIETRHTEVGGDNIKLGFGGSALPLVLEHNTPNNSVALLWAESSGEKGRAMRPLFRRRQRHSG